MSRISILLCLVAFACGGSSKPAPTAPLPADPPAQPVAQSPTPAPKKEEPPPAPSLPPLSMKIEPQSVKVKLVSAGKGTKTKLAYAPKPGVKQQVELAIDFYGKTSAPPELGGDEEQGMPTIVLGGDGEARTSDQNGSELLFTVTSTDARPVAGRDQVPIDKLKVLLTSAKGLTLTGKVAPNGAAIGDSTLALDKPEPFTAQVMQIIQLTMPSWPVFPTEAIGAGAKWKVTATSKLMGKVVVTTVTDYELVSKQGTTWSIKGKTKLTGSDQQIETSNEGGKSSSKFTAIQGTGQTEVTLVEGALFPTFKTTLDASFQATEADKAVKLALKIGTAITAGEVK